MVQMNALVVIMALAAVTMIMWSVAMAQSGCTSALVGLAPCLSFIQGGSSNPSSSCCSGLSSIVQTKPSCLCQVINGGGPSFGLTINQTQALALPDACKVQTPPASQCNVNKQAPRGPASSPVDSPTGPPSDASTPERSEANSPTLSTYPLEGVRSKSTTKTRSTSDGIVTKLPLHFILLIFITFAIYYK